MTIRISIFLGIVLCTFLSLSAMEKEEDAIIPQAMQDFILMAGDIELKPHSCVGEVMDCCFKSNDAKALCSKYFDESITAEQQIRNCVDFIKGLKHLYNHYFSSQRTHYTEVLTYFFLQNVEKIRGSGLIGNQQRLFTVLPVFEEISIPNDIVGHIKNEDLKREITDCQNWFINPARHMKELRDKFNKPKINTEEQSKKAKYSAHISAQHEEEAGEKLAKIINGKFKRPEGKRKTLLSSPEYQECTNKLNSARAQKQPSMFARLKQYVKTGLLRQIYRLMWLLLR